MEKKYKFMCVYKYTCVVLLLFHLVIVLWLCKCSVCRGGSEQKIKSRKEHLPLILLEYEFNL